MIAVQITSLVMKRIPRKWWKLVHLSSYGLLWTGLIHGAQAGSDAGNPLYIAATSALVLTVGGLTIYRIVGSRLLKNALAPVPGR